MKNKIKMPSDNGDNYDSYLKHNKSNWIFERSSGYAGWRCSTCMKWVYMNDDKICECKNEK